MLPNILKTKKGFTLMELLVTVILVAVLASYSVYHYNNTMDEGKLNAAKGKLAALGGAVERYKIENLWGTATSSSDIKISPSQMNGSCDLSQPGDYYNVFRCGYAEKSLGISGDSFDFYIGNPKGDCGGEYNGITVYMTPKETSSVYPKCAYFHPDFDKVLEVK